MTGERTQEAPGWEVGQADHGQTVQDGQVGRRIHHLHLHHERGHCTDTGANVLSVWTLCLLWGGERKGIIPSVPQCLSPRPNWVRPPSLPQASVSSPGAKGGGGTLACGWWGGRTQFERLERKPGTLSTLWVGTKNVTKTGEVNPGCRLLLWFLRSWNHTWNKRVKGPSPSTTTEKSMVFFFSPSSHKCVKTEEVLLLSLPFVFSRI